MALKITFCVALCCIRAIAEEDLKDFDFSDPEIMIAQESRQYQTIVKPPVKIFKPTGVTNSHRPQYNVDSEEDLKREDLMEFFEATTKKSLEKGYKPSYKLRSKEAMIREAVLRALERKDHVGKFAQILPIIRSMSGNQRVALASLVASQVTTPPGRSPLNLIQVRSMFGNNVNTSTELMLPILFDMANLIRKAVRPGKEIREVHFPQTLPQIQRRSLEDTPQTQSRSQEVIPETQPQIKSRSMEVNPKTLPRIYRKPLEVTPETPPQMQRRSEKVPIQTQMQRRSLEVNPSTLQQPQMQRRSLIEDDGILLNDEPFETSYEETLTTKSPQTFRTRQRSRVKTHTQDRNVSKTNNTVGKDTPKTNITSTNSNTAEVKAVDNSTRIATSSSTSTTTESSSFSSASSIVSKSVDNITLDLAADATNQTLIQDIPLAEKLRSSNRYVDRKGNPSLPRRPPFPKPSLPTRRTTAEPNISLLSSRDGGLRRRPAPARKLPVHNDGGKCELFTNSLCLHTEDYPADAIILSIRRNKAAAGALLADFKDPGEGAVDGITAAQEAKYTAEHYLISNRRGDTANRDFASAGEAGFMCPSTVKYARPQRARATSGQWKYIVNTGEHTQTLRLEKCLKPKESCTYLTDNFKSKCVQVYNYHRLLTWDQQNGLHMDIFKVPTCCSCHIEGYSVAFPPLGHRTHESSAENFPGEDLSSEHGNGALESVQSTIQRPISKKPPFGLKPLENFPAIGENHNVIPGSGFASSNLDDGDGFSGVPSTNPMDSYGNSYFPDTFNQASNVRNIKRQPSRNQADKSRSPSASSFDGQLPSYLEPPTPNGPSSFGFGKDTLSKYKITSSNQYKRGAPRPQRRPIRKNISGAPDDLMSSGTSAVESQATAIESLEDFNDDLEEPDIVVASNYPPHKSTIAPKLQANIVVEGASTSRPTEQKKKKENLGPIGPNGKRVNYNYHPIIDFFEEDDQGDSSIDREDSIASYVPAAQTEWKPIDHPVSRNTKNKSVVARKKHK